MSPFTARCTRSRCKGGGNDLSSPTVTRILRITADSGTRNDLSASPRNTTPSHLQLFQDVIRPSLLPLPIFYPLAVSASLLHFSHSAVWINITRVWFKWNRNSGKTDAAETKGMRKGRWYRSLELISSTARRERYGEKEMGGGGFNILIKTTRSFVVGVDEG